MIETDKGHFKIMFENGYVISIFNGFGSYSDNHFSQEAYENSKKGAGYVISSNDCEIAILFQGKFVTKNFIECNNDVKGYISANELADIICKVKNFRSEENENRKI